MPRCRLQVTLILYQNDFIVKNEQSQYFDYGNISIGGNFYQYIGGTTEDNFVQRGTKVAFTGAGAHEIYFDSTKSYFTNIEMDNGSSISFECGNKKLNNLFANGSPILSINSNTAKAVKVGNTKLTVNFNDGSKSDINIAVNKSDYVEEPPVVTTPVTTKPVTTTTPKTTTVPPTTTVATKPLGDVNSDNKISVADVVLLQRYLVKKVEFTNEQWKLADLNSDGKVNVFDVIILKRKFLK